MDAAILSVGTELLTGQTVDTNAAWLAARLTAMGAGVARHVTVGDDEAAIEAAVREALAAGDVLIITGGLGPTADDLTRAGVARALGAPLEESPEALTQITAFFARWQRPMPDSNRLQAMIPRGCGVLANPRGTAPGICGEHRGKLLFVLPGVPSEMKAMFEAGVAPGVASRCHGACTRTARVLTFGVSEATVGEAIADLMVRDRNPLVGTTASAAVISVRIIARGEDATSAEQLLAADRAEVRRRLGSAVFGEDDDTLQSTVASLLTQRRLTIATAESCTGGLLAKRLTDVPGSSAYFVRGLVTYSDRAKSELLEVPEALIEREGAVSQAVAEAMAAGCRARAGTDIGLSITGIAGPTGGRPPEKPVGLVYLGLARAEGIEVKRLLLGEHLSRGEVRDRACKTALNLIRLRLLGA